jgi:DNA-binding winged helix-turn-helix (wHTH) protein/tetratricopeptide (TPR) repeat protein
MVYPAAVLLEAAGTDQQARRAAKVSESLAIRSELWLDAANECLWQNGQRISLPPKAFLLLDYLSRNSGRLVPKDELLDAVWPGTFVGDAVLKVNIRQIRDLAGDDARAPWLIETVHRRGYRMMVPLPRQAPAMAPGGVSGGAAGPLVGRAQALAQLQQAWSAAIAGSRQIVFVTGEPGIGKTALVEAFLAEVASGSTAASIGQGYCVDDYGASEAYMPVLDALEDLLRCDGGAGFGACLRRCAPTWVARLPGLLDGAGNLSPATAFGASREMMLREIATALEIASAGQPMILLLEDLHWSDPSTATLLAFLGQRRQPARLLVIGTLRPVDLIVAGHPLREVKQTLLTRHQCSEIPLWYLECDDIRAYLERRLGREAEVPLAEVVLRRTSGNPLFVVSVVEHLVARGLLEDRGEGVGVSAAAAAEFVPESVRGAIERRLDGLDAADYAILEAAGIAGVEFHSAAVASALSLPFAEIEAGCEKLSRRGDIIRGNGAATFADGTLSGRYEFVHALYQNVLYDRTSPARRMEMHRRLGAWAEAHAAGPSELAHHFARCGSDGHSRRAIEFAVAAARRATSVFAYEEAVAQHAAALRVAESLVERDARLEAEMRVALGESLHRAGHVAAAEAAFLQGAAEARALAEPVLLARAATGIGHGYQRIGEADPQLIELLEAALAAFGDAEHPAKALVLAHLDYALSSVPGAITRRSGLAPQALAMARRVGDLDTRIWVLQYTRWAFRGPQSTREWQEGVAEIESLLPQVLDAEQDGILRHVLVTDLLELGEVERARAALQELVERVTLAQIPWLLWLVWRLRTALALFEGRLDEAEALIDETLHHGQATDHPNVLQMYGAQSTLLAIERGQFDEVGQLVDAAIAENPAVPTWRSVAAFIAAERGRLDAASEQLEILAADDFGNVPQDTAWLLAMCFAAVAVERLGDAERGRRLHDLLAPYCDRCTGMSSTVLSLGHPERYVGLAGAAAGMSCAARHLENAHRANRRMGAAPWAAKTASDRKRIGRV